jgi:hypothetical protein
MSDGVGHIRQKIKSFQRKYYLNIFIKGTILTLAILIGYFVLASLLEHSLWMSQWMRLLIFISFFGIAAFCVYKFLNQPLQWWIAKRGLDDQQAARLIGKSMPTVKDHLVNLIQLSGSENLSTLTVASVQQKSREFEPMSFETVINLSENRKYLKYLLIPLAVIVLILLLNSSIITRSTERIVHFNREYSPEAPFKFLIQNQNLNAFYNEDFTLIIKLDGTAIPTNAYLVSKSQRLKLISNGNGEFSYVFEKIQQPVDFQIEAAGFYSDPFAIKLITRPELIRFSVELEYPRYLQRKNEKLSNAGNLEIPEGTQIKWKLNTSNAEQASIAFSSEKSPFSFESSDNQLFTFSKKIKHADQYEIVFKNERSRNREKIAYAIEVIKDQFPLIQVNNLRDSVLYQRVLLGGSIADDYGVTELGLHFKIRNEDQKEISKNFVRIPISRNQVQQNFFYNWSVDSLDLKPGDQLEYYLEVWDNDGVNGRKSTKSSFYTFLVPTEENLVAEISRSQSETQDKLDKSVTKANKLQDKIQEANQKLKGKQTLDWQDKKMLEDIIQQKQGLDQMVNQLKEENKLLDQKKEAFTEQSERIKEKAEQLQKLMDELLDEDTKKLFEELQKLLKDNADVTQMQKLLDKMNQNSNNLEKDLERTLELFKELQYEFKLDQAIQDIKKQVEEQKDILDRTESLDKDARDSKGEKNSKDSRNKDQNSNKDSKTKDPNQNGEKDSPDSKNGEPSKDEKQQSDSAEKLASEQEDLQKDFKETSEKLKELEKMQQELNKGDEIPSEQQSKEVQQDQQESKDQLQQNQPKKATQSQKQALQKMEKMQQQMESMQISMMMEMDMENIEALRQIIHGLVKLSYDQESLMKEFNELLQSDPRFNTLAQRQIKLKDDSKILEDSLLALGKRDAMMGSFITKEIGDLNDHLEKVIEANRERKRPQAATEMQMSMTSINNLALMLDDHFDMMMQMMANAQLSMKKSKQKAQKPSMSQMQQQLNERIQQLKNSGKSGRELSEELAEMAAEQERIRRALQEMQEKMKKAGQQPGGDIPAKMEQTEMDLVNKQLTDQLIKRQKEILTRLLETEKSAREQDQDEERKGETAKDYEKEIPRAFEEYLRLKEKEVELLKTVPPKLYPYYKKEVNEYFKRMGTNK